MNSKIKKIIYSFIIFLNILFFASPILPTYAAGCPEGKVAVIGDSLTVGYGPRLKAKCPKVDVFAKSGAETSFIKGLLEQNVLNGGYNQVIIFAGVNDANNLKSPANIEKNLADMYKEAKDKNIAVTAITIPYWTELATDRKGQQKKQIISEVNTWIQQNAPNTITAPTWVEKLHSGTNYTNLIAKIMSASLPATQTTTTPTPTPIAPTTPTTNDVKATCKGTDSLDQSQTKDITFSTTETDQSKIATGASDQCYKECDTEGWTNCSATVNSVTAQAPTQTPIPGSDGSTPATGVDTTAQAPTFEPNPSSLVSGSTACEIWKNAFNLGISFIGVAALAGVIWGGFGYITSYGNQEKIKSAKETIWGSVGGMFIGLFAYVLFSLVNPYVLQCKIDAPFKLSISGATGQNPSGTGTQGQGQGQGGTLLSGSASDLGKCAKTYDTNNKSNRYTQIVENAARTYNVDPFFLESTLDHESSFDNGAVNKNSGTLSMGQFMPGTFDAAASEWSKSTGKSVEQSCLNEISSGPVDPNAGYCSKKRNPNCPAYISYSPRCKQWVKDHSNEMVEIVAVHLKQLLRNIPTDNYACVAAGYFSGAGGGRTWCKDPNMPGWKEEDRAEVNKYVNKAATLYNKACQRGK
ncbi:MAG: GDSL-type esterase/lipase family protein [Patescibacteria group bacterium]|jgi:hypothetical protein